MKVSECAQLIILGDGANWITNLASIHYPQATLILDGWHLNKRVWETANWLTGRHIEQENATPWGRVVVSSLGIGKSDQALTAIEQLGNELGIDLSDPQVKDSPDPRSLYALYPSIKNNPSQCVDYQALKQQGDFISSVFAEKTVDLLICRRLKLGEQNWSQDGADNIVGFRQLILNDQWDPYSQQKLVA